MARYDDEDALSWGGGIDDPTHADGVVAAPADPRAESAAEPPGSSVLLVLYGILAGAYLLFAVGWIIGIQRDTFTASTLLFEIMYQFGELLAIASPLLWFGLTVLLTRNRRPIIRVVWLLIGLALVAPWPFLLAGATA